MSASASEFTALVDAALAAARWPLGASPITVYTGGYFELAEEGEPAVVMATDGVPSDLVAWHPGRPHRWWLHRGLALRLGEQALTRAQFMGEPVRLYASPENWLLGRARREDGVCVLQPVGWMALRDVATIVAEDLALAERANRQIRLNLPRLPEIRVAAHA